MKKFIDWTEELSVGIQEIDEQHKILVDLINRLYESIVKQTDTQVVNDILTELVQYTVVHFAVEESLMRIFDYPDYEDHKKIHQELQQQVIDLHKKVKENNASISMDLLKFLKNWLTRHIFVEDQKYGPFFLERGLKGSWSERSWVGKIWNFVHK
jgi:hemerythrin